MTGTRIDTELGKVPQTVRLNGEDYAVLAAVFVPGGVGWLASHIVVYHTGDVDEYVVHYLVHSSSGPYLALRGAYGIPTYGEAVTEMLRFVASDRVAS